MIEFCKCYWYPNFQPSGMIRIRLKKEILSELGIQPGVTDLTADIREIMAGERRMKVLILARTNCLEHIVEVKEDGR